MTGPLVEGYGGTSIATTTFDRIHRNVFDGSNAADAELRLHFSSNDIKDNFFLDTPTSGYLVRAASTDDAAAFFDASRNLWATAHDNSTTLGALLEDNSDNPALPLVSVFPWLQSQNYSDLATTGVAAVSILDNSTSTFSEWRWAVSWSLPPTARGP